MYYLQLARQYHFCHSGFGVFCYYIDLDFVDLQLVMYKTIFVINIIIYICLQHIDVYEFKTAVFLSLMERICFPKEFAPLRMLCLLLKDFAPL